MLRLLTVTEMEVGMGNAPSTTQTYALTYVCFSYQVGKNMVTLKYNNTNVLKTKNLNYLVLKFVS